METKEYSLKINHESNLILITGINSTAVSIDFSGDIDFTKLVSELTQSIDSKTILSPKGNNDTSDDSTLKLILDTIDSIFNEYNNTIASLVDTVEEAVDFDVETEDEPNMDDDDADLPF